jgi:hypothetical protein
MTEKNKKPRGPKEPKDLPREPGFHDRQDIKENPERDLPGPEDIISNIERDPKNRR